MTLLNNKNNYREGVKLAPPIKQVSVLSFEKQADNKVWYIIKVTPIPTTTQVYLNDNIKRPHRQRKSYLIARTYEDFYYLDQKLHSEFTTNSMNLQQQLFGFKQFSQMIFFNNSNSNINDINNDPIKKNNHDHFSSYILPKLKIQRKKSFSLFPKLKINQHHQQYDYQPKEHHYLIEKLYELQRYCELLLKAPTDITKSLIVLEFFGLNKADTERIVYSSSTAASIKSPSSSFHVTPKQPPTSTTKLSSVPTSSPTLSSLSAPHPLSLVSPSPSQISINETNIIKNDNNNVIINNKNASMPNLLKLKKRNKKNKKIEMHSLDTFLPLSSMESVLSEDELKESNNLPNTPNSTLNNNNNTTTTYSSKPTWKNHSSSSPMTPPLSPISSSSKYSYASSTITSSTSSSSFSHQLPYFMMMMSSPPLPSSPPSDFPFTKKGNPSKSVLPAHGNTSATKHKVLQQNKQNKQYKQSNNNNNNNNNKQQNRFPSSLPVPLYDTNNTKQQLFHDQLMQLDNTNKDDDDLIIIDDNDDDDDHSSFYLHKRKPLRPSLKSLSSTLSTNFSLLTNNNNNNNSNNNNETNLNSATILSKINNHQYSPSPYIKLKVVYDLDNIIMIQVPRTIKLPELRATILHKFDEIAADLPVDFKLVFNSHSSSFSSISSNNTTIQQLQQQQQSDMLRPSSPLSAAYSTYAHLDNRTIIESQEDLKNAMSTWSALTKVSVRCVI